MKASDRGGFNLGIRKTPEFMDLVNSVDDGGWINLSAFEEKEKPTGHQQAKQDGYQKQIDLNDEIPFALLFGIGFSALTFLSYAAAVV